MGPSVIVLLFFCLLGAGFVVTTVWMVRRLTPERRRGRILRWLSRWGMKGMGVPLVVWMLMNVGLTWWLQPYMPQVQMAQRARVDWFGPFLCALGYGVFVVTSFWMALTLAWTLVQVGQDLEDEPRAQFRTLAWMCCFGMLVPALIVLLLGGWPLLGLAAGAVVLPLAGYAPVVLHPQQLPPMYARAIARIKFGKYAEAEMEIIRELERSEDDFEGWLMLAGLYAEQFHDLGEAERTVLEICNHPKTNPSQLAIALHRLADWQLKIGGDPDGARRALQLICDRLRGSHLARMASLRVNQLPATVAELRERQDVRRIPLPGLRDPLDMALRSSETKPDRVRAVGLAKDCMEILNRNPDNAGVREKLARLLAEQMGQVDDGLEQLQQLLEMAGQPEAKRADWLALRAAWQLGLKQDIESGRRTLARLLREFPDSPQALPARRRLAALGSAPGE